MANYRHQVLLRTSNGVDDDTIVNTWHTRDGLVTATAGSANDAILALVDFYVEINEYISDHISAVAGAHEIRSYALNVGAPGEGDDLSGSPIATSPFTIGALGVGVPMPPQVSTVLSMKADTTGIQEELGATRPAARRRGRVYLPPTISSSNTVSTSDGPARPSSAYRTALLTHAGALVDNLNAAGHELCVYSRVDGIFRPVSQLSVDNSFDVIRSRKVRGTVRQQVSVTQP